MPAGKCHQDRFRTASAIVMSRRVVVTGMGVISPNGTGKEKFWRATVEGESGVDLFRGSDSPDLASKIAAQVVDFDPLDFTSRHIADRTDRYVHFGLAAAKMAIEDSGLVLTSENSARFGICIGSVFGGTLIYKERKRSGCWPEGLSDFPAMSSNSVAGYIAMEYNFTGPNMVISTTCASGVNAIGRAFRLIQNKEADIILSGGVEAPLTSAAFHAFGRLQFLSLANSNPREACRPFDKGRDGFVLGEGAAMLVLEEMSHAVSRNARIYGEILGYAANCGSYHMILPAPDGIEAARVMKDAMKEAEIGPREVDYINAYGNATLSYDRAETRGIKIVFEDHAYHIPVSSIKSMIGHTIGASGAIEAVSCFLALENNIVPPTINYKNPDPECDLDYVPNRARKSRLNNIMINSLGIGNENASLIIGRPVKGRCLN